MIRAGTYDFDLDGGCHVTVHAPRDRSVDEIIPQIERMMRERRDHGHEETVGRASSDAA